MVRLHARERRSVLYQPKPELNVGPIEHANAAVSVGLTKFEYYSVNNQSDQKCLDNVKNNDPVPSSDLEKRMYQWSDKKK
jgi:hypothetical protein